MDIQEFMEKWELMIYRVEEGEVSGTYLIGNGLIVTVRTGYADGEVMGWIDCFALFQTAVIKGDSLEQVLEKLSETLTLWGLEKA